MKNISKILNEMQEIQYLIEALSWIEARRPTLDLSVERRTLMTKREELAKTLQFQVCGVNLK